MKSILAGNLVNQHPADSQFATLRIHKEGRN